MNITVILTSYNHAKYLAPSIESVLNQTWRDFDLIIVDDCSTDGSWEIICDYQQKDSRITTIRHPYNWGGGSIEDVVRNYAKGDYIAIHHCDDLWEKDKLKKQVETMRAMPECAAVFTNASAINEEGEPYADEDGFYYNLFAVKNRTRHEWLRYFFYEGNCLCHPSILIKKEAYMEDGFFRKGLRQIPDFVKWIQVCKRHEIFVLPEPLVRFRVHNAGKNTSGMRADTQIRSTVELFLMLQEYAKIRDREEFLKIFPEAEEYCTDAFFDTDYVFGRLCTREGMPSYTRLFGNQLLYGVLNEPQTAKKVAEECHYTKKDYTAENGRHDIFSVLPKGFEQTRTVYLDVGDGYHTELAASEKYTFFNVAHFEMNGRFVLKEGQRAVGLRFDPVEGVMIRCKIDRVLINGKCASCAAENAVTCEEGSEIFIHLDPIYSIALPEGLSEDKTLAVTVTGTMERLTEDDIGRIVTDVMYDRKHILYAYQEKCREAEALRKELDKIKETKAYQVAYKINTKLKGTGKG